MPNLTAPLSDQDHVRGDPRAMVTLIEYGGYRCPHSIAVQPVVTQLLLRYRTGLRHAFRHFPFDASGPEPDLAAEAAEFAGSRGAFWHMHAMLFVCSTELTMPLVFAFAERLRLPGNGLRDALATGAFAARVRDVVARGARSGVEGTPTLFIDGRRHSAPVCFDTLAAGIGQAIERSGGPHAALRLHG